METIKLGIGVLPNEKLKNNLIKMSNNLSAEYDLSYVLDGYSYYPHLTLYQSKFNSLIDVEKTIESLKTTNSEIQITLKDINLFSDSFAFYDCEKSKNLRSFHENVVNNLKDYIAKGETTIGKEQNLTGLTPLEINYMNKYGYPFIKESFRPHFTIGRILNSTPQIQDVRNVLKESTNLLKNYTFSPYELIIYKLGVDGSCVDIFRKFKIKNKKN